jgi:squalene-hopene/tetraprenyl-beta-curcumene cyclase
MSRHFPFTVVLLVALGCVRSEPAPGPLIVETAGPALDPQPAPPRVASRDESLAAGVAYLLAQQSEDGAWRSDVYATFKDGTALTPLAVTSLQTAYDGGEKNPKLLPAIAKGLAWLAKFSKPDGSITPPEDGFDYPIYTAALTLQAFSHASAKDYAKHRDAWVKYLKERQLTEKLDWKPEEKQYGGWGYCRVIPKKPDGSGFAPNLIESNLSATVFALEALSAAGALDADTQKAAAIFVRRCQNWALPPPGVPPPWFKYLDGGFHFIYDDPVRNKAGAVPKEAENWPQLFHSYGSTTADGLRALHLCNQKDDEARIKAAREWLVKNYRADTHPGAYIKTHEVNREAVYYYYASSVARAFRDHKLTLPKGRDWSAELPAELAKRQAKDGSWSNPVEAVRENDPIVATCNAVSALAKCK